VRSNIVNAINPAVEKSQARLSALETARRCSNNCAGKIVQEKLYRETIQKDWYDKEIRPAISFFLSIDSTHIELGFSRQAPALLHPSARTEEFVEGLWNYDVIELFLSTGEESYLELNLSPQCAWWAMHFSSHRVRDNSDPRVRLVEQGHSLKAESTNYRAVFNCNRKFKLEGNVCGIIGIGPRQHFSLHQAESNAELDFHSPKLRQTLLLPD
jgi:hypothetical protein